MNYKSYYLCINKYNSWYCKEFPTYESANEYEIKDKYSYSMLVETYNFYFNFFKKYSLRNKLKPNLYL